MSTLSLVLLAIATALIAIGALVWLRWREQKRLAMAREAVHHSDQANALGTAGEQLKPWLSTELMHFLSAAVQLHVTALQQLKAPVNKASAKALESALLWQQDSGIKTPALPTRGNDAQVLRQALRFILDYLRDAYKRKQLQPQEARTFLLEAKRLNIRIALSVFDSKATAAATLNNHHQAIHFLRKAEALLSTQADLPEEFVQVLAEIRTRISTHEQERQKSNRGTRLEEGAEILSAEDDAWKKKKFD